MIVRQRILAVLLVAVLVLPAGAGFFALPASAQQTSTPQEDAPGSLLVTRVSTLLGYSAVARDGASVGAVQSLVLDISAETSLGAMIFGGAQVDAGILKYVTVPANGRAVAVPMSATAVDPASRTLQLQVDRATLAQVPANSDVTTPAIVPAGWDADLVQFWTAAGFPVPEPLSASLVIQSQTLAGFSLLQWNDQSDLGRIQDLVVEMTTAPGTGATSPVDQAVVKYALLAPAAAPPGSELAPMPLIALQLPQFTRRDILYTSVTATQLAASPALQANLTKVQVNPRGWDTAAVQYWTGLGYPLAEQVLPDAPLEPLEIQATALANLPVVDRDGTALGALEGIVALIESPRPAGASGAVPQMSAGPSVPVQSILLAYGVIRRGGFLNIGATYTPVPYTLIGLQAATNTLVANVTAADLNGAPTLGQLHLDLPEKAGRSWDAPLRSYWADRGFTLACVFAEGRSVDHLVDPDCGCGVGRQAGNPQFNVVRSIPCELHNLIPEDRCKIAGLKRGHRINSPARGGLGPGPGGVIPDPDLQ